LIFRRRELRYLKNSLLIPEEFLNAKKLQTLQSANQNSSLRSSDSDLLEKVPAVLVFLAKIPEVLCKLFFKS